MVLVFHICQLNLPVDRLLVHIHDLFLSHLVDRLEDLLIVTTKRFHLDLLFNFWVLWEYLLMKHLFCKCKALHFFVDCHVNEL